MHVIILSIGKRAALMSDDPHRDPRVAERFLRRLDIGRTPPADDVRPSAPGPEQRQVGFADREEFIGHASFWQGC